MYDLIDFTTDKTLQEQNDNSCLEDFYRSDNFIAHFENGNEDETMRIEGTYVLELEEIDNSIEEDTRNTFEIEKVTFEFITVFINDVKVHIQNSELQSRLNDIENKITNYFYN